MVKALWADRRSPQKIAEGYQTALVLTTGAWEFNLQECTFLGWVGSFRKGEVWTKVLTLSAGPTLPLRRLRISHVMSTGVLTRGQPQT